MYQSVIYEVDDGRSILFFLRLVVDDVSTAAEAVCDFESWPVGGYVRIDGKRVALFVEAKDVLDTRLVSPGS